jgi:hypothetical protein
LHFLINVSNVKRKARFSLFTCQVQINKFPTPTISELNRQSNDVFVGWPYIYKHQTCIWSLPTVWHHVHICLQLQINKPAMPCEFHVSLCAYFKLVCGGEAS